MIDNAPTPGATSHPVAHSLTRWGQLISRYGLVVVLAWIGFGKYVKMESRVLIENSPLMSWIYDAASVTTIASGLGTREIVAALLIALRPVWPRASAAGSALTVVLFLGTVSFLFTTPGVGREPRGRPSRAVGAARPVPAQGSCADRGRSVDPGRLARGRARFARQAVQDQRLKSVPLISFFAELTVAS